MPCRAHTTHTQGFWQAAQRAVSGPSSSGRGAAGPSSGARRQVTRMMPIGVPRVPYRTPREGGWQWVDIWNCLYRERIIFLSKAVDEELGNQLVATMLYLDSENRKDINLYMNCSGGDVVPCLALHDTMRHVKSDVGTVGFGGVMGMSGFLLAVGAKVSSPAAGPGGAHVHDSCILWLEKGERAWLASGYDSTAPSRWS
jgi:hypothetical protein